MPLCEGVILSPPMRIRHGEQLRAARTLSSEVRGYFLAALGLAKAGWIFTRMKRPCWCGSESLLAFPGRVLMICAVAKCKWVDCAR
jgi:hypothetical protein